MIEKGIIKEIINGEAIVALSRSENCASCKGCLISDNGKTMLLKVKSRPDISPGDEVSIEFSSKAVLSSGFRVLVFPLIMFLAGIFLGNLFLLRLFPGLDGNSAAIVGGLSLLIVAIVIVYVIEKRSSKVSSLSPQIIDVNRTCSDAHASEKKD